MLSKVLLRCCWWLPWYAVSKTFRVFLVHLFGVVVTALLCSCSGWFLVGCRTLLGGWMLLEETQTPNITYSEIFKIKKVHINH